ncbi:hypothetical protein Btru_058551 [Bulinus truncatus]|nr:hypothetical protein Btru_058551 [Bulinus truncatus]
MTEALQINETSPEVLDSKLAEWFGLREDQTHQTEIQRLTAQWMNSLTFNEGMSGQELPTLLHLAAKYNFAILTQTLLMQPWASMALQIKNKDGLTPYRLALKHQHEALSQYLAEGFEAEQSSPEFVEDIYMKPEYCSPDGEILLDIIPRQHFVLNINLDSSQMFTSIPEEDNSLLDRRRFRIHEYDTTPAVKISTAIIFYSAKCITPDSDKKSIIHGRQYSLDSSGVNQRSPGQNVTSPPNLPHRGVLDRSSPTSTRLFGGRPPTPPRQAQMLTVFGHPDQQVKTMNQPDMQKQNAQSQISKNTYSSNKGNKMEPGKLRRSSLTASQYIMPTPSLLKSSQSMSRINEVSLAEEFIAPVSKAKASPEDGQPSNKHQVLSGTPKPCYPVSTSPPPLPVRLPPPFTSIAPPKSRFNMAPANNDAPPLPEKAPRLPVKLHTIHRQAGLKRFIMGKNGVISPDFSQPIEVYFADPLARKDFSNEYITPKTDNLNESIYEEVDIKPSAEMPSKDAEDDHMLRASGSKGRNSFHRRILLDNESTLEALKQLQSELARMEPSPSP